MRELDSERVKTDEEKKRADALRAAFNADKSAFSEKIRNIQTEKLALENEVKELTRRLSLNEITETQTSSEINFFNGKVSNMRRDLDMQLQFN